MVQLGKKPELLKARDIAHADQEHVAYAIVWATKTISDVALRTCETADFGSEEYNDARWLRRKFSGWEGYGSELKDGEYSRLVKHLLKTVGRKERSRTFQSAFGDVNIYLERKRPADDPDEDEPEPEWDLKYPPIVADYFADGRERMRVSCQ